MNFDISQDQISIEQYAKYPQPQFEIAVANLMAMRSMKQLVLFEWERRYVRDTPEIAEARRILEATHHRLLLDVWNTHPNQGDWHYAEAEGMWVKCEVNGTGERTIFVASHPHPQALVGFSYTLKGE